MTLTTNEPTTEPVATLGITEELARPCWSIQLQNDLFDALALIVDDGWTQGTFKHKPYNYETNAYDMGVKFCALGAIWEVCSEGREHANNSDNLTPWQNARWEQATIALHNAMPDEHQIRELKQDELPCDDADCTECKNPAVIEEWAMNRLQGRRRNAITNWNDRRPRTSFAEIREVFIKALFLNAPA